MNNRAILEKANNHRNNGQNELAAPLYEQLLKLEPNNDEFLFYKALNISKYNPLEAIDLYERILEINPKGTAILENVLIIAKENNLYKRAISVFDKVLKQDPDNLELIYLRATLIADSGEYLRALIDFYSVLDNSTLKKDEKLFEEHNISKGIKICKIHLSFITQDRKISFPIPNENVIRKTKIKEYEYFLPLKNKNSKFFFIDFGKHMGLSIQEVLQKYPDYLIWCIVNLNNFCVSEEIIEMLRLKGLNIRQAENINLFKLQISREEIPSIEFNGEAPDTFSIDKDGNIIY